MRLLVIIMTALAEAMMLYLLTFIVDYVFAHPELDSKHVLTALILFIAATLLIPFGISRMVRKWRR